MAQTSYSTSFESPNFTAGLSINGQGGWSATNPSQVQTVSVFAAHSGSQSWLRGNTYGNGVFGDQPFSPGLGVKVGESGANGVSGGCNQMTSTVWFKAASATPDGTVLGYALTDAVGNRSWSVNFRNDADGSGGFNVLAYGISPQSGPGTSNFVPTTLGANLDRTAWHSLTTVTTFNNGESNDTVSYVLDGGAPIFTNTWEQYYRYDPEQAGNGNQLWGVDRFTFRSGSSNAGALGIYFDDLSYSASQVVPAPGALGLLAGGGLLAARRRRR
jgi:hypothetical protein